jgi:type I restriction enzyme R subunit
MTQLNVLAANDESTVVSEYTPEEKTSASYQSEAELESEFIHLLERQGYEYLNIDHEDGLIGNLRTQLEKLNEIHFSDKEWKSFFDKVLANPNDHIVEKTRMIQRDNVQVLKRDDGTSQNITLIDKKNIHRNTLQVIHQYVNNDGTYDNRYDVTILVNGFPMVHVELKRRGVNIKDAFNQINRYQRDSFWASYGLFEYVQIFVISNGTETKYYSNTTRFSHIKEADGKGSAKKTSNSFEFTSYWADAKNVPITDLIDFTKTFFARHAILNILTKYCVFTSEELLLVMRPYQITATERILNRIKTATNYHWDGSIKAGGYIWHTTGSGKTLTSFKTAQLATELPYIDKVLFVVDRRDLDYQTVKEYERFEKGCVDANKTTAILERQLNNQDKHGKPHDYPIIVTTIQKLSNFVEHNAKSPVQDMKVVIIFDECHRSQFGEMHQKITKYFRHYYLFGFTGTPIFAENARVSGSINPELTTTPQLFGGEGEKHDRPLHAYTVVDAIRDGNVLPFRIDYINTMKEQTIKDEQVEGIDTETGLLNQKRISAIVKYMLDHYNQKTRRNISDATYTIKRKDKSGQTVGTAHVSGFNSILATQSIKAAICYYKELKKQIEDRKEDLKIGMIYCYNPNEADPDEETFDVEGMDQSSRDSLNDAIKDYNEMFHCNYDTSSKGFQDYYKDLSVRMKNRELDILIVVDMFLTGFDATTMNTLWVDKNLKMHGLFQAFSRTNRILNSVKKYGNIVCFRNLQEKVNEAIKLFGNKDAGGIILLKPYEEYYFGYEDTTDPEHIKHVMGYKEIVEQLLVNYMPGKLDIGEKAEKEFIKLFGNLLRVMNILSCFDRFEDEKLLTDRQMQDYQSDYLRLHDKYRPVKVVGADISDDLDFEIELIKQVDVNIDYIINLVGKEKGKECLDREVIASMMKVVDSSPNLRSKKELIEAFLNQVNLNADASNEWHTFVNIQLEADVVKLIKTYNLKETETRVYLEESFNDYGQIRTNGTTIDNLLPPMSRFSNGNRDELKQNVIDALTTLFDRYYGVL